MKYVMRLCARPDDCSIDDRHGQLVAGLTSISGAWGLPSGQYPTPEVGENLSARFALGNHLGKGIKGFVSYRYRAGLRDESDCDDLLDLEFNPKMIDFQELVTTVFLRYAIAFNAYLGFVGDEEFTYIDFDRTRNVNKRYTVVRFYPTMYFDQKYCCHAIGTTPRDFLAKAQGLLGFGDLLGSGVCYSAKAEPMEIVDAERFNDAMRERFLAAQKASI